MYLLVPIYIYSRQYFANATTVSSSFIGYSSEMVAVVVKKVTDYLSAEGVAYARLFDKVNVTLPLLS